MRKMGNVCRPADLLPERWRDEAFIAGGFAASPALASDIDLWVSVPSNWSLNEVRQEILDHLQSTGCDFKELEDRRVSDDVFVDAEYMINLDMRKVAIIHGERAMGYEKPVHVIVVNGGPVDVLAGFDISTHQVALWRGRVLKGPQWTPLSEYPVKLKDTLTTDARMVKLTKRYAHLQSA